MSNDPFKKVTLTVEVFAPLHALPPTLRDIASAIERKAGPYWEKGSGAGCSIQWEVKGVEK